MNPSVVTRQVHFARRGPGARKEFEAGPHPTTPIVQGRVPRVARLMALALRCQELLAEGVLASRAELAALGRVTRARVSQILNLLNLAPDLQETLLFLPRTLGRRDALILRQLQPIASTLDWGEQRRLWVELQLPKPVLLKE
jgi:hypothetical protein